MADTYLSRTPSSAGNQKTMTFSFWIKRSDVENEFSFLYSAGQDANNRDGIRFYNNSLDLIIQRNDTTYYRLLTTAKFRDVSAWYHIVIAIDTTDSTSSNRFKMYVNGSQITDFQTETYPTQNLDLYFNDNSVQYIGRFYSSNSSHFDGYMAEMHLTDGTAYAPTTFGQTTTDGIWTPAVGPSVTYGTNGFYLKFENSGAMGTDSSGNSNTFSVGGGTVRQVPDSPTNVFATLNPLTSGAEAGFSDGNLRFFADTTQTYPFGVSTLGFSSGKWYCEFLREANSVTGGVGIFGTELNANSDPSTKYTYERTGTKNNNGSYSAYGASWGAGDVIGIAYDGSTGDVVYYKNGVSQGTAYTIPTSTVYTFGCQSYTAGTQIDVANFGQDSTFAGNKTAGSNSDANSLGNFLYTVPTGHLALCTDNLSSALTIPINKGADNFNTVTYSGIGSPRSITGLGFSPDWTWIKVRNVADNHYIYDSVRGATKFVHSDLTSAEGTLTNGLTSFDSDGFSLGDSGSTNNASNNFVAWNWKAGGTAPANTYAVKVVSDSGNKYRFDDYGTSAITLELQEGGTFTFDQSDASNSGHPIRFSTTADGTHGGGSEYTTGVTTNGTPGQSGAYTRITVAASAPTLYYYCSVHSGMGGQANTGSLFGFTNVKGSIQNVVSPNITAGFSIVTYTGNGTDNSTIGHGLGKAPAMIILKARSSTEDWMVYHKDLTAGWEIILNSSAGQIDDTNNATWGDNHPSSVGSSTFAVGYAGDSNANGTTYVAYCFAEIEGYSKFGKWTGTGTKPSPFVYTGFKPAWIMYKRLDTSSIWVMIDAKRSPINPTDKYLRADTSASESTYDILNFMSNGFEIDIISPDASTNTAGADVIYMAFAENPLVTSTGTPVTAG